MTGAPRVEAYVPAQQPSSGQDPRFSPPDADARRSVDPVLAPP